MLQHLRHTRVVSVIPIALLCAFSLPFAGSVQGSTPKIVGDSLLSPAAAVDLADDADPQQIRFEEIRTKLLRRQALIQELGGDAEYAVGDDRLALESAITDSRLDAITDLREMVDAVVDLEAREVDTEAYRRQLSDELPQMTPRIHALFVEKAGVLDALRRSARRHRRKLPLPSTRAFAGSSR